LPGFFKAATTPGFAGVFVEPTFIESLYNYGLFLTFAVAGLLYLGLSMLGSRQSAPESSPEREAVAE
jgi:NCS1 family nucleobase:cation symporter-1